MTPLWALLEQLLFGIAAIALVALAAIAWGLVAAFLARLSRR